MMEALGSLNVTQVHDELLTSFVTFFRYLCAGLGPLVVSKQVRVKHLHLIKNCIGVIFNG